MQTITADNAQTNLLHLLQATIEEHRQYRIASEHGGAVLLSEADYEELLGLVKVEALHATSLLNDIQ